MQQLAHIPTDGEGGEDDGVGARHAHAPEDEENEHGSAKDNEGRYASRVTEDFAFGEHVCQIQEEDAPR